MWRRVGRVPVRIKAEYRIDGGEREREAFKNVR